MNKMVLNYFSSIVFIMATVNSIANANSILGANDSNMGGSTNSKEALLSNINANKSIVIDAADKPVCQAESLAWSSNGYTCSGLTQESTFGSNFQLINKDPGLIGNALATCNSGTWVVTNPVCEPTPFEAQIENSNVVINPFTGNDITATAWKGYTDKIRREIILSLDNYTFPDDFSSYIPLSIGECKGYARVNDFGEIESRIVFTKLIEDDYVPGLMTEYVTDTGYFVGEAMTADDEDYAHQSCNMYVSESGVTLRYELESKAEKW